MIENIKEHKLEWPEIGDEEGMMSESAYDLVKKLMDRNFTSRLGSNGAD